MNDLKALIFDVDGTLANTEKEGHRVAFNLAFRDVGLNWEWSVELYGQLLDVAGGKERIRYYLDRFQPSLLKHGNPEQLIANLHRLKNQHFMALSRKGGIPLRSGVQRLLDEARGAGLSLSIATTATPESVKTLLESSLGSGVLEWFDVVAAGDMVAHKKPSPDVYLYVLHHLGLKPEQCIAFEDSFNGFCATRAANLPTIITVNEYTHNHNFDGALAVLDRMGEADQPFRVIQGDVGDAHYLTLELVRRLWRQSWQPTS